MVRLMRVGVDIDTWKLTLCAVSPEVVIFETAKIRVPGQSIFDALQGIPSSLSSAVSRMGVVIDEVYIERGRGQNRKGEYELGAIYGATTIAIRRLLANVHIETVTTGEWKKVVTAAVGIVTQKGVPGNANAPKALANEACRVILERRGFLPPIALSADELDAFGIVYSIDPDPLPAARPESKVAVS